MSRMRREFTPGSTYHIMNKTVPELTFNKEAICLLLNKIQIAARKFDVKITYFNILKNHFHLQVYFPANGAHISKFMHWLGTQMAKAVNKIFQRKGHVFFQRFTSKIITNLKQYLTTFKYIANNTIKHFAKSPEQWPFSSYKFYKNNTNDGITSHINEVLHIKNEPRLLQVIKNILSV